MGPGRNFLLPPYRACYPLAGYHETPVLFISEIKQNVKAILWDRISGKRTGFPLGFQTPRLRGPTTATRIQGYFAKASILFTG